MHDQPFIRFPKFLILAFVFLSFGITLKAQQYSKVKLFLETKTISDIIQMGVQVDHGILEKGNVYTAELSAADLEILKTNHVRYDIIIDDVVKYFLDNNINKNNSNTTPTASGCTPTGARLNIPSHWHLGSMGGYFNYNEMLQILDSMALQYPNLITVKKPVSALRTRESRPVYVVKISDNPNINEAAEPKILYTALHHAREPLSLSQLIMYMYYILENYNTNPEIKNLVDNTEMYFIPCVNPDGYIYNQTTNPNGGGMWRKNRVQNPDLTYGVDLNRNYGKFWGFDNSGSSPNTNDETYRGPSAFSEPETRMIKEFCDSNTISIALHYHTFGNDLIYPWSYNNILSPDSTLFKAYAGFITQESKYKYGTCFETLGYLANGDSDDWAYGEQTTKNKIYAMTPECGSSFWMLASDITVTCQNLLEQNIKAAQILLDAAQITDKTSKVLASATGYLKFDLQRLGMKNTDTFTVKFISLSAALTSTSLPKTFIGLNVLQIRTDSFNYSIVPSLVLNKKVKYVLQVKKGSFILNDTLEKIFTDSLIPLITDNASSINGWTNSGIANWGVSTKYFVSAPSSIHHSPAGNYQDNSSYIITGKSDIDLSKITFAYLEFYARWDIEKGYDYVQVMASESGKNTWVPLCGLYTGTGTIDQDPGNPVYDGTQNNWVKEYIDLNDWLGKKIQLRFQLITDPASNRDGFYFDDLAVIKRGLTPSAGISGNESHQFLISPNPAKDHLIIENIDATNANTARYEIHDITGRSCSSGSLSTAKSLIDIHELVSGMYTISISCNGKTSVMKFVVE